MLNLIPASSGLLFASFLYRRDLFTEEKLKAHWEKIFGESFLFVPEFNPLANYYAKEMGEAEKLSRFFVATAQTFPREALLSAKLLSLDWEREWAQGSKRMVNVDIGFISLENFLLATTKNYSHRIYLGQNIFADLTYQFVQGEFQSLPWTYPDYIDPKKIEFIHWLRGFLLQKNTVAEKETSFIKK
jgi:hypothetical protein